MFKRKLLIFSIGVLIAGGGCSREDEMKKEVELPTGERMEMVRPSPETEVYRGRVKELPMEDAQSVPPELRTKVLVVELEDGEVIIPRGLPANRLRREAVGKDVVFRGVLQREPVLFAGKYREAVTVEEIIDINSD